MFQDYSSFECGRHANKSDFLFHCCSDQINMDQDGNPPPPGNTPPVTHPPTPCLGMEPPPPEADQEPVQRPAPQVQLHGDANPPNGVLLDRRPLIVPELLRCAGVRVNERQLPLPQPVSSPATFRLPLTPSQSY